MMNWTKYDWDKKKATHFEAIEELYNAVQKAKG